MGKKTASSGQLHRYGSHSSQQRLGGSTPPPPPVPAHHYEDRLEPEEGGFVVSSVADNDPWGRAPVVAGLSPQPPIRRQGSMGSRNRIIVLGPEATTNSDNVDDDIDDRDEDDDDDEDDDVDEEDDDYEEQDRLY